MPNSSIRIQLEEPSGRYLPGTKITGTLHLNVLASFKVSSIVLKLRGDCATSVLEAINYTDSDEHRRSETRNSMKNELVPFLYTTTTLSGETAFSPGEYQFPFSISLPTHCTNSKERLKINWLSTPLPSSVENINSHGTIRYSLCGVVTPAARISFSLKTQNAIKVMSGASFNPPAALLERRKFIQQRLNIKLYEYEKETYGQWTKRLVGFDTSTGSFPLSVRMAHVNAGLPTWRVPLNELVSLHVFKPEGLDKKGLEFRVHHISAKIKYLMTCVVSGSVEEYSSSVELFKQDFCTPLEFFPSANGLVADISSLLDRNGLDNCVHPTFVTERVPNLSVSAALEMVVGIAPTIGNPIKPQYARLTSVVNFYNTSHQDLPFVGALDEAEAPPPYSDGGAQDQDSE